MHDRIAPLVDLPHRDSAAARAALVLAIAATAGACALASPPLALLLLAVLAANALLRGHGRRFDVLATIAPLAGALIVGAFAGFAAAVGLVFVWRLFAETLWSMREARRLAHAAGKPGEATAKTLLHVWATPAYGLAMVAFTAPHMVAGLPLDLPHLPIWAPIAAGALGAWAVLGWALRCAVDWRLGELAPAPAAHLLVHHAVMLGAFGLGLDLSAGVAALAAWRLAQAAPLRLPQLSFTAVP